MYIAIIHVYVCNRSVDIVMQVIYTTGNIANTVSNATTTVVVVGVAVAVGAIGIAVGIAYRAVAIINYDAK